MNLISGGTAIVWAPISAVIAAPPTCRLLLATVLPDGAGAPLFFVVYFRPTGGVANLAVSRAGVYQTGNEWQIEIPMNSSQSFDYGISSNAFGESVDIQGGGFYDEV